jgi:hypothetical protein
MASRSTFSWDHKLAAGDITRRRQTTRTNLFIESSWGMIKPAIIQGGCGGGRRVFCKVISRFSSARVRPSVTMGWSSFARPGAPQAPLKGSRGRMFPRGDLSKYSKSQSRKSSLRLPFDKLHREFYAEVAFA